ncbi:MAG TPA: nuclear transport factor 2 family protein [Candidatus Sulfotelmatobacter sp.]|nr:nuclear transport factor 2 family protein [Candidatus Sulfotelmatobacter sp.]
MAARDTLLDHRSPRVAIVEEHVRCENEHNLEAVIQTFGESARYDDEPWNQHYEGREQVRHFYEQLMAALPDLRIEIVRRHVAADTIILEVVIHGTQLGPWRGLPPTGRRVEVPLCGVYTFGADNRLAGEKIYYDRATVLKQLGVFREPQTVLGRITILLTHPLTILQALGRRLRRN